MIQYKKKHDNARDPVQATDMAAGVDLRAAEIVRDTKHELWLDTGIAFDIPEGIYGDLRARSSVSETGLFLANGAGVIDPDYTGTVQFRFYKIGRCVWVNDIEKVKPRFYTAEPKKYQVGDRVGQVVFQPYLNADLEETDALSDTARGEDGFGSTGT
jgi:dUTP pyrophosphatase